MLAACSTRWRAPLRHGLAALGAACGVAAAAPDVGQPWPVDTARLIAARAGGDGDAGLPAGTPLTLAALSDHALRHHPATRAAWAAALADAAGVDAARALLRPTVSASVPLSLNHGGEKTDVGTGAADAPGGIVRSIAPSVSLTWVLFDFGARASAVEAARWQSVASQLAYNRELQTVVSDVEIAYYTLLGAQRLQTALQSALQAAQASVEATQARRAAGLATIGEAAQADAARGQVQLQLIQATAATHVAQGTLANAVGIPVTTPLWLDDDDAAAHDEDWTLITGVPDAQWLEIARRSRADLAALDAQVLQGEALVASTQATGRPSLSLSAAAARRWGSDGSGPATQQLALTLSIPIFDGGLVRAQTQAARARVQALAAQRDQQRQAVDLEVWQSLQSFESSAAAVANARAVLRSAAVAEDAARERYRAGVGTVLELLVAQSTAIQARVSLVQARYDGQMALTKFGYAVGAGLPASPMNRPSSGERR